MDYDAKPREVIEGRIDSVVYANPENGWTVFQLSPENTDDPQSLTCVATMPGAHEGEQVRLTGLFVLHPSYGRQFKVERWEKSLPTTAQGVLRYLGGGVIKGVGRKLAERIVTAFGDKTLAVIEHNPERLAEVKGINLDKAMRIGAVFREQGDLRRAVMFLQSFGLSPGMAQKIYNRYKEATIEAVRENPYALCEAVSGVGFRTADIIAARLGIPEDSPQRVRAGVHHVLWEAAGAGHCFLPKPLLITRAADILRLPESAVEAEFARLRFERAVWEQRLEDVNAVYLNMYYYAECYAAKRLMELSSGFSPGDGAGKIVSEIEDERGLKLHENQKKAAEAALRNGVLIITGGPGTGKTTTINTIISLYRRLGFRVELAAPTGRAAKRMTEATGIEAKTIHRLLGLGTDSLFARGEQEKLDCDAVIIDEASMVDLMLLYRLLASIEDGARLVFVGDVDQLPSVGAGNALKDMIRSGRLKCVRLTEIFRQAGQSAIVVNAHKINSGEHPDLRRKTDDFFFMSRRGVSECVSAVVDLAASRLPDYVKAESPYDVQVLTPTRKGNLGVVSLNAALQAAINPASPLRREMEFKGGVLRERDKVMQIKNNYNISWRVLNKNSETVSQGTGVFNGDEGIVKTVDAAARTVTVVYDGERLVDYDFSMLEELELAYAVTIHKSQGSEYKAVVIPIFGGPKPLMSRNLLYTAITRAKSLAVLVGLHETIMGMVDNDREVSRHTALCARLQCFMKEGV